MADRVCQAGHGGCAEGETKQQERNRPEQQKHASEEGTDSSAGRCHMGAGGSRERRTAGMRRGRTRVRDRLDSRGEEDVAAVALQDALRWPIACRGSVLMLARIGKALLGDPGRHARELLL